ncbi:MAG: hypothetical protein GQ575_02320 [Deltaproteobacteria bacterium]|nr:hypothetical protein [Deltaproteobacteria bacterium]
MKSKIHPSHKWTFRARFRRSAFGWRSQPAIKRVKEAVSEIKKAARKDPILGADGAVLLLEKLSPALEQVDSSSGAIGTAVNNAINALVPIIAKAPADDELRDKWLERLWGAIQEDQIPYIELLPDYWGELCVTPERASYWADEFIDTVRLAWGPDPELRGYFNGTTACLSALLKAGRNNEIIELLEFAPYKSWDYQEWGVKALVAMGKKAEAIRYGENSRGLNDSPIAIARACEEILLSSGMAEEAYNRYAIEANQKTTYLATFRDIAKKYPHKEASNILRDLVASTPGDEGKWFAAAKSVGLYSEAIELANRTPCDPRTLTRAARDMEITKPRFAVEAGIAALRWLVGGYGYDITGMDVWAAYNHTMKAAENMGFKPEILERVRKLVAGEVSGDRFVTKVLCRELGLN